MKKTISSIAFVFAVIGAGQAQDCEAYFPMSEGASWELRDYNHKDKLTGITRQKITKKTGSGSNITVTMHSENLDKKEKPVNELDYELKCENGKFYIDMQAFLNPETMSGYQAMEMVVDGGDMEFPDDPQPGQTLPDADIKVTVSNAGMTMATIIVNVTNRKVEAKETIITPAGTYECYKFTMDVASQVGMMFPIKVQGKSAEWYSPGVGKVRSEAYEKDGDLLSYSVLTSFSK